MEVCATSGNTFLGGRDFDRKLFELANGRLKTEKGIDLTQAGTSPKSQEELRDACENAKKVLDRADEAEIKLEDVNGSGQTWVTTVTLGQFNDAISEFEQKYLSCIEVALNDAHMEKDEIDEVVMVGGSTRVPIVRQKVREYFEQEEDNESFMPCQHDPDTVVAYGATVYASKLSGQGASAEDQGINEIMLADVTPLTIGILQSTKIKKGFLANMFSKDEFTEEMAKMISKNTNIPADSEKTITLTDNDKSLIILEGESLVVSDCTRLGEIPLHGLRGGDRIDVKMQVNSDNILTVTYVNVKRGKTVQNTILDKQNLDDDLVTELVNSAEQRRKQANGQ